MPYQHIYPIADGASVVTNGVARTAFPVITGDGNYPSADGFQYGGGAGTIEVMGTFGAGTATLQMRGIDLVTWLPIGAGITANGVTGFVAPNRRLRLVITGSTAPSLYAAVNKVTGD